MNKTSDLLAHGYKQYCDIMLEDRPFTRGQIYAIMAITIAGFVGFLGIYTSISGIDKKEIQIEKNTELEKAKNTEFIVMLVLACVSIVFGLVAATLLQNNIWVYIPVGIVGAAVLGFFYSLGIKLRNKPKTKLGLSIALLVIVFLAVLPVGFGAVGPQVYKHKI